MTKTNDDPTETTLGYKGLEQLQLNLRAILKDNCTGMDDHDFPKCRKCEDMEKELYKAIFAGLFTSQKQPRGC